MYAGIRVCAYKMVAYTPQKALMAIKGISEQKAEKILAEGMARRGRPAALCAESPV